MELTTLLNKTAKLEVEYLGETTHLEVRSGVLTPTYKANLLLAVTNVEEGKESKDESAQMLSDMIASWDITLDGETFPPSYENLMQLPYPLLAAYMRGITTFLGDLANPTKEIS
jgi:hypothetical protein